MEKIRVTTGIEVEVNDHGDLIIIRTEDQNFLEQFYSLVESMDKVQKYVNTDNFQRLDEHKQLVNMIDKTKEIMQDIDNLFGASTCKKVFGDIVPSPYALAAFFDQLIPLANRYANERQQKISQMYSRNRKGGRSNQKENKYRSKEQIIRDAMGK